jgi:hypothetical protein
MGQAKLPKGVAELDHQEINVPPTKLYLALNLT